MQATENEQQKIIATTMAGNRIEENPNLPVVQEFKETLNDLIDKSCKKFAKYPAIGMAMEKPLTYRQLLRHILVLAAQLREEGVNKGDRVAILAENSHNWVIAYLAIVRLGAVAVPILPDLPEAEVHHILGEMECGIIFITQRQIEKIYDLKKELSKIITLDDYLDSSEIVDIQSFNQYLATAENAFGDQAETGSLQFPEVESNDPASILYTSGTSGFSKAVMLSHANLYANGDSASRVINIQPGSVFLSVLPISHTYEFTVGFIMPLIKGCRIVYAGKTPTPAVLQKICRMEKPHAIMIVPLIIEKIYKKRILPSIEKSRVLTMMTRFSLSRKLLYRRIRNKLREFFGNRLECMGIGGAPLNPDVELFLREADFPFMIGYGLTEAAPLLAGGPQGDKTIAPGSTGKPVPNVEIRISTADPQTGIGEIEARGPNIMQGYWNDPEETNAMITDDGWLRTGDLGLLDEAGNLHLKGRAKSVIVPASGENIYPEAIEHKLNSYPFVVESLVLENNGMIEAWIYPDYEFIDEETRGQSRQQRHRHISSLLEKMRTEVNATTASNARLTRVLERREPFVKTATHKIKRYLYSANNMIM